MGAWNNWPTDLHVTIRKAILDGLEGCAPQCEDEVNPDCAAYGFNGGLDVWPLTQCCEALTVSPGAFMIAVNGSCFRIGQQEFTVRYLTSWPVGTECRDELINGALLKLSRCGQKLHCVLSGLALPTFSEFSRGNCRAVVFDGRLMPVGPQGACVGWTGRIMVGK